VTVFDSFTLPATARLAIAEIRALTAKPVRTLINSHWHQDHRSGNDEFRKARRLEQERNIEDTARFVDDVDGDPARAARRRLPRRAHVLARRREL